MPVTLALVATGVMQASASDAPATLVGVGEGVAVGVGDGVAVGVGVGGVIPDAPSSRATLVERAETCSLTPASSATCLSSAASLFITSPDATEVAVGVGVATEVASQYGKPSIDEPPKPARRDPGTHLNRLP